MPVPVILIMENSIAPTGALISILRSSIALRDHYRFIFVLPEGSSAGSLVGQSGFEVYYLPMKELRKTAYALISYIPFLFYNAMKLRVLLRKTQARLVVVNDFYNLTMPVTCFLFKAVPYVCYIRFRPSRFPRLLVRFWVSAHRRYTKRFIAVSNTVRSELPDPKNPIVIYNELPAEPENFSPPTERVILYPANFTQGKGQDVALRVFSKLAKRFPDWKLRFVGGTMGLEKNEMYLRKLVSYASGLHLDQQVEWISFQDNLKSAYLSSSVVLNFSTSESFSLTCLEGLYYGRVVLATRSGGPEEIITHEVDGFLVDLSEEEEMQSYLEQVLSDIQLMHRVAKSGYDNVRVKFDYSKTIGLLDAEYRRLVE